MSGIFEEYLQEKLFFASRLNDFVRINTARTVVEIGCCEGEDTIKLQRLFKKAAVFAIEALPKNVELTKKHLQQYSAAPRVKVFHVAMSDKQGTAVFHVSSGKPEGAREDPEWDYGNKSSSLLPPNPKSGHSEWLTFKQKITVPTDRLDNFCVNNNITEIDFLHMDVQGAELLVLRGSGAILQKTKAIWLEVEAIPLYTDQPLENDIEAFMKQSGFTCVISTVGSVTGDKLYIRNDLIGGMWSAKARKAGRPRVTVLMSAYNSQKYLREAIDSILSQTFKDFEFLIIDDGSTDKSLDIISKYKDPRIRLVTRENWGLTRSLNQGIALANGDFIARQDSDDVSVRQRLAKEVEFLDKHPNVGMVGSNYTIMDGTTWKELVTTNVFTHPNDLKLTQITCNQYGHGSVMMRMDIVRKLNGYDATVGYVEDYDLWTRISQVADIANFEEPLYLYRRNADGITQQNLELQIKQTFAVRDKAFQHFLKHRWDYRVLFYKPSGTEYRRRKAVLYRDLAYLYRANDRVFGALCMMFLALCLQPRNKKNYYCLQYVLYKPRFDRWEYEFL